MKWRRRRKVCPIGALREHQRLLARRSARSAICTSQPRPAPHHTAPHCSIPHRTAPSRTSLPCPEPYHAKPPLPCSTPHCFTPHRINPHCPAPPRPPHTTLSCTTQLPQPYTAESRSISPPGPASSHAESPCTLFPPAPDITLSPRDQLGRGRWRAALTSRTAASCLA